MFSQIVFIQVLAHIDGCFEIVKRITIFLNKKNIFFVRSGLNGGLFEKRLWESS